MNKYEINFDYIKLLTTPDFYGFKSQILYKNKPIIMTFIFLNNSKTRINEIHIKTYHSNAKKLGLTVVKNKIIDYDSKKIKSRNIYKNRDISQRLVLGIKNVLKIKKLILDDLKNLKDEINQIKEKYMFADKYIFYYEGKEL